MKYIIMAGGPATRWRKYNNTTKHLIKIGKENLLERLVRQLRECNAKEIFIVSDNELYEIPGATRIPLAFDCKLYNMFYYKYLDEPCTFLYGDTYYYDSVINEIISTKTKDIVFFGTQESIVAIKVQNHEKFKYHVDKLREQELKTGVAVNRAGWAVYRKLNSIEEDEKISLLENFTLINESEVANVNDQQEYEQLVEKISNQARY